MLSDHLSTCALCSREYEDLLATHDVEASKVHVVLHGTDADRFAPVTPVEVDAMRVEAIRRSG